MSAAAAMRHVEGTDGIGYDVPANATSPVLERPPARSTHSRHFSYITGQYTIGLGWDDFTRIMDLAWEMLDQVTDWGDDGSKFDALIEHLAALREQANAGWGGIPGKYLVH